MQLLTAQTDKENKKQQVENFIENIFLKIGFTHHITLINKCKDINERLFYFQKIIENQWSVTILEHHISSRLYQLKGKIVSNFDRTLPKNYINTQLMLSKVNIYLTTSILTKKTMKVFWKMKLSKISRNILCH